jgi:hypothetical protein
MHAPRPTCNRLATHHMRAGVRPSKARKECWVGSGCGARARLDSLRYGRHRTVPGSNSWGRQRTSSSSCPCQGRFAGSADARVADGKKSARARPSQFSLFPAAARKSISIRVAVQPDSFSLSSSAPSVWIYIRAANAGSIRSLIRRVFFSPPLPLFIYFLFPSPPHGHYRQSTTTTTSTPSSSLSPGRTPSRSGAAVRSRASVPLTLLQRAAASSYPLRGFQVKAAVGVSVGGSGRRGRRKDRGHGTSCRASEGEAAFNSGGGLSLRTGGGVSRMAQADDVVAPLLQGEDADAKWNSRPRRIALFIEPSPFASVLSSYPEHSSC